MSARNRTYRPAAQSTATTRPSPDGGWREVFPPAAGPHNPRRRETTRVTPFANLHIGSFAHLHIGSFANLHIGSFANYSLKFTFSAKERDTETGLSYFGARYYSSDLSLWLSVDPMSGKYPSLSSYVYCADNPVKLVDPNGEEVIIDGNEKDWAVNVLSSKYENLHITCTESGNLAVTVLDESTLSDDEKHLMKAITSTNVSVHLTVNSKNSYLCKKDNKNHGSELGGAFMGNELSSDKKSVTTYQFVCNVLAVDKYFSKDLGDFLGHEITESYEGGMISLEKGVSAEPAFVINGITKNPIYDTADERAITCPLFKETQMRISWGKIGVDYDQIKQYLP